MNRIFEVKSEGYTGTIEIEVLKYIDRLKLVQQVNFKESDGKMQTNVESIDSMIRMLEVAPKFVKSVDVFRAIDQKKFSSWEDLSLDGDEVCIEAASAIFHGAKPSKN